MMKQKILAFSLILMCTLGCANRSALSEVAYNIGGDATFTNSSVHGDQAVKAEKEIGDISPKTALTLPTP